MIVIDAFLAILYVLFVVVVVLLALVFAIPVAIIYGLYYLLIGKWRK